MGSHGAGGMGGAPPEACQWPLGVSYGVTEGSTLPQHLVWQGVRGGSGAEVSTVAVGEWHDCDGVRGVNALYFVTSEWACEPCQQEASELSERMDAGWRDAGIAVVELLVSGPSGQSPTTDTAEAWRSQFGLTDVAVLADPMRAMVPATGGGVPLLTVVDPRSMRVVVSQAGYPGPYAAIEKLARDNAEAP